LWEIISLAIDRQKHKPAFNKLVAETRWECWKDICNVVIGRQPFRKPIFMLVRNTVLVVKTLLYRTTNVKKEAKMHVDNQVLLTLVLQHSGGSSFGPPALLVEIVA
jgi:hypothetical protein